MSEPDPAITKVIQSLSLEEKARLISGGGDFFHTLALPGQGIPSLALHDGPHGLRKQASKEDNVGLGESLPATSFPSLSTVACTFDPDLTIELGRALGAQAKMANVDVLLAPGANIKRHPLCGRNFEYFSEDPLLAGEMASAYIKGVQSQGVGASLKHFAANNQEFSRMVNSSDIDERALREIYLKPFEIAIAESQPWTVMNSYNRVNGVYACENDELLTKIARNEWGFGGLFMTDWGGMNDRVEAISAGTDLEMPPVGDFGVERILEGIRSGRLKEIEVDRTVQKILELISKTRSQMEPDHVWQDADFDAVALKTAVEAAVLLKNEDTLLPLAASGNVVVVGLRAEKPHYQGAGSSRVNPRRLVTFLDALEDQKLGWTYTPGYTFAGDGDEALASEAIEMCRGKDAVVFFAGLSDFAEAESYDRQHLELPAAQNALIERISSVNPNVVVVLQAGSPVYLPWMDRVKGVLLMGLSGQMGGAATLELLLGRSTPSGKLAESWPLALEDTPAYENFGNRYHNHYRESVYVGYRYYDSFSVPVRFPFGFGLSYTTFALSLASAGVTSLEPNGSVEIAVKVRNTGQRMGKEVLQLYVSPPDSAIFRPLKELRAFRKVEVAPDESKEIRFRLECNDFSFWNPTAHTWHCEAGDYQILIGTSSSDTQLKVKVHVQSGQPELTVPDFRSLAPEYYAYGSGRLVVSDQAFGALLGRTVPSDSREQKEQIDLNTTLWDVKDTLIGKLIGSIVWKTAKKMMAGQGDNREMNERIVEASAIDTPFRSFVVGGVPMRVPEAIVLLLNGKVLKAIRKLMEKRA